MQTNSNRAGSKAGENGILVTAEAAPHSFELLCRDEYSATYGFDKKDDRKKNCYEHL